MEQKFIQNLQESGSQGPGLETSGLDAFFLRLAVNNITPVTNLLNLSLQTYDLPHDWKSVVVNPHFSDMAY